MYYKDMDTFQTWFLESAYGTLIFILSNQILNFIIFKTSEIEPVKKMELIKSNNLEVCSRRINCYNVEVTNQEITIQYMVHRPVVTCI
jgi:hypothetical protein